MFFLDPVPADIAIVADGALVLLESVSLIFSITVVYICATGNPLRTEASEPSIWPTIAKTIGFVVLGTAGLTASHVLAHHRMLLPATFTLALGIVLSTIFYFAILRRLIRPDDQRIQYTMLVWVALALITVIALQFLWLARSQVHFEVKTTIGMDVMAQVAGVVISAAGIVFTYIMKAEQSNRTANQQIYQTLELQSVDLFRFEIDHPKLVESLWFALPQPAQLGVDQKVSEYQLKQYVCQMLNLFEMAYRFRSQGIMAPDVFGSWVIWMWELCSAPAFRHLWNGPGGLPVNYTRDFRQIIQKGIQLHEKDYPNENKRRQDFFAAVADILGCNEIDRWLEN